MSARRAGLVLAVLAAFAVTAAPAAAADRSAPSKPANLRLVAKTSSTISIAWDASKDNSGKLSYQMHLWQDPRVPIVPQTQTSFTWTGLRSSAQYYLYVVAIDPSGNKAFSDQLIVQTLRDTSPPAAPTGLKVDAVTSSSVSLSWNAAVDDGPIGSYRVLANGGAVLTQKTGPTSAKVIRLASSKEYSFTVTAIDTGNNASPPSAPVAATTLVNTDFTPPSAPELWVFAVDSCEVDPSWTTATDNQTPHSEMIYELYVNGELTESVLGVNRTFAYGNSVGDNTFVLYAIDAAGNRSAASNPVTLDLYCPFG